MKVCGAFLNSYWLLRKSILNLANKIFPDPRQLKNHKSLTQFGVFIIKEHFGQVSEKSVKSTYPINSFEAREFSQN